MWQSEYVEGSGSRSKRLIMCKESPFVGRTGDVWRAEGCRWSKAKGYSQKLQQEH